MRTPRVAVAAAAIVVVAIVALVTGAVRRCAGGDRGAGSALLVVAGGTVRSATTHGFADRDRGVVVDGDTRFELASVTKLFTALAVLRIVERGVLALDAPVAQFASGLPPWSNDVRVVHLLTHCDGLPDDVSPDRLASVTALDFAPGSRCVYGDSGYRLLARIVEVVEKKSFGAVLRDEFFVPLGMTRTVVDDGHDPQLERGAVGHHRGGWRDVAIDKSRLEFTSGDSGVLSTLNDLAKFAAAFDDPKFLPPASRELAFTRAKLADGSLASFGCGFAIGTIDGRRVARHTGGWAGFRSLFAWFPDDDAAIVVLANVDDFDVERAARAAAEQWFTRLR